jgi:hypothetical protein
LNKRKPQPSRGAGGKRGRGSIASLYAAVSAALPGQADALPHERDESSATERETPAAPQPRIRQAQIDVERGLLDTERRGIPSDVPAPDGDPRRAGATEK